MNNTAAVAERIRKAGFRSTPQRGRLLTFLEGKKPLRIREIADALRIYKIDHVTVYRMIDAFQRAGVVKEVNFRGRPPMYELNDNDHHHIICPECEKVEDFEGCDAERVGVNILKRSQLFSGSKMVGHSFEFYALCNRCSRT
jgi:Fe2+ or Zn2+ uptake regulation protein